MSCMDNIIDRSGELLAKALINTTKIVGKAIALPVKASAWSLTIMLRGALYIASEIHESIKSIIESNKYSKELLAKEECQRLFELDRLLTLSFQRVQELHKVERQKDLSEEELEIKALLYVELLNNYEGEREIVFPNMLWKRVLELKDVDFFRLSEEELCEKRQLIKELDSNMEIVDERANAVIYALKGEEYTPGRETLCIDEELVKEQCVRLLSMWIDFENALSCKVKLDELIKSHESVERIQDIKAKLDTGVQAIKEKIKK